ncbi:MAG: DUF222 domain-containing protein [Acidimicrobiales bacterium]
MFDPGKVREKASELAHAMAELDPTAFDPSCWRMFVAELRRILDTVEAQYARSAAGVDVAWLAQATGSTVQLAKQHAAVGAALVVSPVLADAVRAGEVALENVAVLSAVAAHPAFESSPLVDAASVLTPPKLRAAVDQWRAVVDRAADETHARSCHRRRSLKFFATMDGMVRIDGLFEAETGRVMRHAIDDLVRIHRLDETGRTPEQRRADALIELANAYNAGTVTGGRERPHILVTIDVEQLNGHKGGRALLDTGETITIEAARRLACDANIASVLMNGRNEILDFGRSRRVASDAQYKALVVRDAGCRFPGCDRPPGWCQAHHIVQWPDGGRTDLDNLVLLCLTHHQLVHHQHWRIEGSAKNLKLHPPQTVPSRAPP